MARTHSHQTSRLTKPTLIDGDGHDGTAEKEASLFEGLQYFKGQLELSDQKIGKLLRIPRSTIQSWLNKGRVPLQEDGSLTNDAESLVHLLAIHRSLEAMFENPNSEKEWLSSYREELKDKPVDLIARSFRGLLLVREYLDYMRGRGA